MLFDYTGNTVDESAQQRHFTLTFICVYQTWFSSADCIWEIVKVIFFPESSENDLKIGVCVLMARLDTLT